MKKGRYAGGKPELKNATGTTKFHDSICSAITMSLLGDKKGEE